jgi:hypothetical protein
VPAVEAPDVVTPTTVTAAAAVARVAVASKRRETRFLDMSGDTFLSGVAALILGSYRQAVKP